MVLKILRKLAWNVPSAWVYVFKRKGYLDSVFLGSFSSWQHYDIRETSTRNFPHLYSQACFFCLYENLKDNNILPNRRNYLYRVLEISLTWFLLISVFKIDATACQVTSDCRLKVTFDFNKFVSHNASRGQAVCQIMRCISLFLWIYTYNFRQYDLIA